MLTHIREDTQSSDMLPHFYKVRLMLPHLVLVVVLLGSLLLASGITHATDDDSLLDQPYIIPRYVIHITETNTTRGPEPRDFYVLDISPPDKNGVVLLPDSTGAGVYVCKGEITGGSYKTPRQVCDATRDIPREKRYKWDLSCPQVIEPTVKTKEIDPTVETKEEEEYKPPRGAYCGDGLCQQKEKCDSCWEDCACPPDWQGWYQMCNPSHPGARSSNRGCVRAVAQVHRFACARSGSSALLEPKQVQVRRKGTSNWIPIKEKNALTKGDQITITSAPDCLEVYIYINWVYPRDGKMYVGTRGRFWLRNQNAKLTIGENAIESGWPTGSSEVAGKAKIVGEIITLGSKSKVFTIAGFFLGAGRVGESGDKYDYCEVWSHIIFEETESGTTFYTLQGKAIFKGGPSDVTVSAGNKVNIVEGMVGQPVTFSDDELDQSYLDQPWCSAGEVLRDGECVSGNDGSKKTGGAVNSTRPKKQQQPSSKKQTDQANICQGIQGIWRWFNGAMVECFDDGKCTANNGFNGEWNCLDATGSFEISWSRPGQQVPYVDTVKLAPDGWELAGVNQAGQGVGGVRPNFTGGEPKEGCEAIHGTWRWSGGAIVECLDDGTCTHSHGLSGRWRCITPSGRFEIRWSRDGKTDAFIDTVLVSPLGSYLTGRNQYGVGMGATLE